MQYSAIFVQKLNNCNSFPYPLIHTGQMVANIRKCTGVNLRGTDLDEESRLVLISGTLSQVLNAFDMVTNVVFLAGGGGSGSGAAAGGDNHYVSSSASTSAASTSTSIVIGGGSGGGGGNTEVCAVELLIEHSKAGRVVGAKGATLQALKQRSGAVVRVDKEPLVSM